jgi:anti-sigma regulatory factor (Ser/Thr protein kinase)
MANPRPLGPEERSSLVSLRQFIQATRDSGYKDTASAVSELVDNALQAGAVRVVVRVWRLEAPDDERWPVALSVEDDGEGMDAQTLGSALRFGGTSRFDDRGGLGRFGMGLPNASLSQARRLDVFSWQQGGPALQSWLDLDRVAAGFERDVPAPRAALLPTVAATPRSPSGTLVIWSRCDRLDLRRPSTIARRLSASLGCTFRHFLWSGVELWVNDERVRPIDPLFLQQDSLTSGAEPYGDALDYELDLPPLRGGEAQRGRVTVTFSELPVRAWHDLPLADKRRLGIIGGAGAAIVRAGRQVDFGWFFMGSKRRENYDDWWRCEIIFDPNLDEAFGITHTKQQIRPAPALLDALSPDLEVIARALNARARRAHQAVKVRARSSAVEAKVESVERRLPTPPRSVKAAPSARGGALLQRLTALYPELGLPTPAGEGLRYRLVELDLGAAPAIELVQQDRLLVVVLNTAHPFHERVYRPLSERDGEGPLREALDLLVLSLARAEIAAPLAHVPSLERHRGVWGQVLSELLRG